MPTGYTANIYEGTPESFEDFVLQCARGMGAFIMQRDDAMSDKPKMRQVEPYYINSVARDEQALREWLTKDEDDAYEEWREYVAKTEESNAKYVANRDAMRKRYEARLAEVMAWKVPADLQSLKDFIIEQINQSVDFDCGDYTPNPPQEYDEWTETHTEMLKRSVQYSRKAWNEEVERVRKQNEYTATLYASLGLEYGK